MGRGDPIIDNTLSKLYQLPILVAHQLAVLMFILVDCGEEVGHSWVTRLVLETRFRQNGLATGWNVTGDG